MSAYQEGSREKYLQKITDLFFSPEGRISRGLWWGSIVILSLCFAPVGFLVHTFFPELAIPVNIVLGVPGWFVSIKRFHDRNKSGWWVLIGAIPVIGGLWILIECGCLPGISSPNRFGYPGIVGSASRIMAQREKQRVEPAP